MKNLTATRKGILTGLIMIGFSLLIYYSKGNFENGLQYITYAMYIAGIIWTLIAYQQSSSDNKTFKNYFSEGFKCFVVVTLLMVAFTFIFLKLNPGMKEDMALKTRAELNNKGNYMPAQVDEMVEKSKQYFVTMLVSMATFGYLIIGALITAITSGFLSQQKKTG